VWFRWYERQNYGDPQSSNLPLATGFIPVLLIGALAVLVGAVIAWPLWSGLVRVFLPVSLSTALLDWQRFRPDSTSSLAR